MGRIVTLDPFEYEYEYRPLRRTEHEYEKNHDCLDDWSVDRIGFHRNRTQ